MRPVTWWRRLTHRGRHHAHAVIRPSESVHAALAAARHEQARVDEALERANEADVFMRQFRRAFNLPNGHGTGTV